jgi:hypothetical protein
VATAEQALSRVDDLYKRLAKRRRGIERREAYLNGAHPLVYATEEWKRFHAERYRGFSDNWCEVVATSAVDRLRIDGFRLSDSTSIVTDDEKQLWGDWQRNELTSQSNQGFLASSVSKRSYTLVWGNEDDEPDVSWERADQVIVDYAPGGRQRVAALKAWLDREREREYATLYLPDGVYKFERAIVGTLLDRGFHLPASVAGGGGWTPRLVDGESWPVNNPFGEVPVVEWLNRPRLGGDPISDIDGVIAMQDTVNAMWGYLFAAADFASMPARVVIGGEPPKVPILDDNGQMIGTRAAKMDDLASKRLLFLPQADRIDQYEAAKSDFFVGVIVQAIGHIAAQTRTPGHYLLTNEKFANLNGDALTAAEVPLVSKCANKQLHLNPAAKDTAALMALARGKKDMARAIRESDGLRFVQWKDPAMHAIAQIADAATKDRAVGMSLRTVLERRYGFSEEQIEQELARVRAEQEDPVLSQLLGNVNGGAGSASGTTASGG